MEQFPSTSLGQLRQAGIAQDRPLAAAKIADTQSQADERSAKAQGTYPVTNTAEMKAENPSLPPIGTSISPTALGRISAAATSMKLRNQGIQQTDIDEAPAKGNMVIDDPDTKR